MTNDPNPIITDSHAYLTNFNWLIDLSPMAFLFLFIAVVCYFIRRLTFIPNKWLLPVPILGALVYVSMPNALPPPLVLKVLFGILISIFGIMAAITAHDNFFTWLARYIPIMAVFVSPDVLASKNSKTDKTDPKT